VVKHEEGKRKAEERGGSRCGSCGVLPEEPERYRTWTGECVAFRQRMSKNRNMRHNQLCCITLATLTGGFFAKSCSLFYTLV